MRSLVGTDGFVLPGIEVPTDVAVSAVTVRSPSSSVEADADAELSECVLLCRSWDMCLAIADEPEDEKSFCVSLSWKDVVGGMLAGAASTPPLRRFALDEGLDSEWVSPEESLKFDLGGKGGLVDDARF